MKPRGASRSATSSGEAYCPDAGDIIWLDFDPQAGHEQAGRRPALVLTPRRYNDQRGLCVVCPVTNRIRGHSGEVVLPDDVEVTGAVLIEHIKSASWVARNASFVCRVPSGITVEVRAKLRALLQIPIHAR